MTPPKEEPEPSDHKESDGDQEEKESADMKDADN